MTFYDEIIGAAKEIALTTTWCYSDAARNLEALVKMDISLDLAVRATRLGITAENVKAMREIIKALD